MSKNGMYGEMPKVNIGEFTICQMSEGSSQVWIENNEGEAGEFNGKLLEPLMKEFFNKHF